MKSKGFTLIELILTITVIGILSTFVVVSLKPAERLANARNKQRQTDINVILNAVYQYALDNNGSLPNNIANGNSCTLNSQEICKTGANCSGLVDLSSILVGANSKYLISMPIDPISSSTNGTAYQIYKNPVSNRITVCAPLAENGAEIKATR